jgi:hypothetical protein
MTARQVGMYWLNLDIVLIIASWVKLPDNATGIVMAADKQIDKETAGAQKFIYISWQKKDS